jgi:hypothetical protein
MGCPRRLQLRMRCRVVRGYGNLCKKKKKKRNQQLRFKFKGTSKKEGTEPKGKLEQVTEPKIDLYPSHVQVLEEQLLKLSAAVRYS